MRKNIQVLSRRVNKNRAKLIDNRLDAQESINRLESTANQGDVTTNAQVGVGDYPISIDLSGGYVYVANEGSNTVIQNLFVHCVLKSARIPSQV